MCARYCTPGIHPYPKFPDKPQVGTVKTDETGFGGLGTMSLMQTVETFSANQISSDPLNIFIFSRTPLTMALMASSFMGRSFSVHAK